MGSNSPSARKHRALRFLAHLEQYKRLGPLFGPKEAHQPDHQWGPKNAHGQPMSVNNGHGGCTDIGDLGPCDCLCHRAEQDERETH